MSANRTTELREKLDVLEIEHFDYDKGGRTQTQWEAPDGKRHFTYETYNNPAKTAKLVISWFPTPEQAIAATLGSGECEKLPSLTDAVCIVRRGGMEMHFGYWRCSKCGCENFEGARYCMNCGREVVKR